MAGLEREEQGFDTRKAVGQCPDVMVSIGDVNVKCLLDTGAQVSTITEEFYRKHFKMEELTDISAFLRVTGANGLEVPYIGFIELSITALGRTISGGFLVVRNPASPAGVERKKNVPGVIGSNILRLLANAVKDEHGGQLPENLRSLLHTGWAPILALYEEMRLAGPEKEKEVKGKVRIAGQKKVLVPARTALTVECSVQGVPTGTKYDVLVEEMETTTLPGGIQMIPGMISVTEERRTGIQFVNYSNKDHYLQPRTPVGKTPRYPICPTRCIT